MDIELMGLLDTFVGNLGTDIIFSVLQRFAVLRNEATRHHALYLVAFLIEGSTLPLHVGTLLTLASGVLVTVWQRGGGAWKRRELN